jgi:lipopolysaccharide/colanic/teichoic acid biosynthesis glycosyltransferase
MKRAIDIIVSLTGLLILLPLFFVISVIIFLEDFKNPFFCQNRVGQYGKMFKLYKFRSMSVNKLATQGTFDAGNKSRVTSVGKFIRKTKIDELPQLYNVLKGEMTLVGPRPEVSDWVKVYPERWAIVHKVKPGITDKASIEFRHEEEILARSQNPEESYRDEILPRKLEINEEYAKNHSILTDIIIILKTFKIILTK